MENGAFEARRDASRAYLGTLALWRGEPWPKDFKPVSGDALATDLHRCLLDDLRSVLGRGGSVPREVPFKSAGARFGVQPAATELGECLCAAEAHADLPALAHRLNEFYAATKRRAVLLKAARCAHDEDALAAVLKELGGR